MEKAKIKPIGGLIKGEWRKIPLMVYIAAVGQMVGQYGAVLMLSLFVACGPTQHIPSNPVGKDSTYVHYIDSVRWNVLDSVRILERSIYKDYAGLLDTLRISIPERANMTAWADTVHNVIKGTLTAEPVKEKIKIEYKERLVYKDSIRYVEKPVPYEVEKEVKYIPWIYKVLSVIGLLWIVILIIKLIVKIKTMGILK